jgi:ketosteroid isomerase-like protein
MSEESMTTDLVELLHQNAEACTRRDVDAVLSFYALDAVIDLTRTVGIAPRGRAAIGGFLEEWLAAYQESKFTEEEPLDLGDGVVFAVLRQKASPVGTTGFVQQHEGWVFVFVDGLVERATAYQDIDEARAAAERLAESRR